MKVLIREPVEREPYNTEIGDRRDVYEVADDRDAGEPHAEDDRRIDILIGDPVKDGPELALCMVLPGDVAVHQVENRRDDQQQGAREKASLCKGDCARKAEEHGEHETWFGVMPSV